MKASQVPLCTWSLLLALGAMSGPTRHIARSLISFAAGPAVPDAVAARIVQAALDHNGVPATCRRVDGVTFLDWHPEVWPTASIIIPTRHNEALMDPLLDSLRATARAESGPAFDVLVVDNGERTPEHEAFYDRDWVNDYGFALTVLWWTETPFHYGHVNNEGVRRARGDVVVLLNDDTVADDPAWLSELVGLASLPGIGCAGSALTGVDGRLQHAGVWLGLGGYAGHLFAGMNTGDPSIMGPTTWYRNVLAVTAACLAVTRENWNAVNGLDDRMILCGSDVTLGLDLTVHGLRNVCSPHPRVRHLESATRSSAPVNDQIVSLERYAPWHDGGDPYFNERLSLRSKTPVLKPADEAHPVVEARKNHGWASSEIGGRQSWWKRVFSRR